MKKLMVALAAVAMAAGVQAASFDWKCSATSADVGSTVYILLGSTAKAEWSSVTEIASASISSDSITKYGTSRATYYAYGEGVSGIATADSVYAVVVSADGTKYGVGTPAAAAEYVYDPSAQQGSPGAMAIGYVTPTKEFGGGPGPDPIPEPTSGLLLLLGVAGLALRRRRA